LKTWNSASFLPRNRKSTITVRVLPLEKVTLKESVLPLKISYSNPRDKGLKKPEHVIFSSAQNADFSSKQHTNCRRIYKSANQ